MLVRRNRDDGPSEPVTYLTRLCMSSNNSYCIEKRLSCHCRRNTQVLSSSLPYALLLASPTKSQSIVVCYCNHSQSNLEICGMFVMLLWSDNCRIDDTHVRANTHCAVGMPWCLTLHPSCSHSLIIPWWCMLKLSWHPFLLLRCCYLADRKKLSIPPMRVMMTKEYHRLPDMGTTSSFYGLAPVPAEEHISKGTQKSG